MTKVDNGGPAFPMPYSAGFNAATEAHYGMSLRTNIATHALAGYLASFVDADCAVQPEQVAKFATECADALLAELRR